MSQPVGDLVVKIDGDSAKFDEEVTRLNRQLAGVGKNANTSSEQVTKAFAREELAAKRAGISVGQYRAAMRTLPAQFTDIATQLAGGQSPWLILLQQGGQIKDSFGGLRPTFSALMGSLNPVTLGITALGATVGALGYAFYTGQSTLSDYTKTLELTGNKAGQTANNLLFVTEQLEDSGSSFTKAKAAVIALASAGADLGGNYQAIASDIARLSDVAGVEVNKLAEIFGKITSDPEAGLKAMSEQYGHVTAAQLDYVHSLQEAGKYTEALNYANTLAASGFKDMADNIQQNMGFLERAANAVGDAFSWMWNKLLDLGKQDSLQKQLADATDQLYELDKALRGNVQGQQRIGLERAADQARKAVNSITDQLHAEQRKSEEKERQAALERSSLANQKHFQSIADAGLTKEQQRTQEYQRLNRYIEERKNLNQALSAEEIAQYKKGIEEKYKDPKKPKQKGVTVSAGDRTSDQTSAETLQLMTQLKVLQQHKGLNDTISEERKKLWSLQAKFTVIEEAAQTRALSKEEQSLLASKEKVLTQAEVNAKLGDQIAAQERLNKLLDNSLKYTTQMREKTAALTDSNGLGSKEAQRNLERAQLRQGWKNQGGNLSDKGYQDEISALESYYSAQDKLRSDWQSGAMTGLANFADEASDLNQLTANAVSGIMNSATSSISSNLTSVLTGATSFKDGLSDIFSSIGQTVIQTLIQMATQALITKAILSSVGGASGGGLFGSLFSGLSFNAKGGVYDSPSLSAYSNEVYSSPQLFAFAKGAGIFAEAGPEAIMPLARTAGGALGVRAIGPSGKVQSAVDSARERANAAGSNNKFEFINHFNTKPDDAMLAAFDKRQRESEKRLVKYLTSQVMEPTEEYGRAIRSVYPGRRMK
ncbi:TPA: phage tail tape measure protein [Klebsiella pneumoniae]|nr:phage tail tape measure protein [Klebsiella pneumoniae]HEI9774273.1 phage tail tape measure protein [Klebsiella pneumoniae]HEO9424586.1 phage tail tape measure protein [Klebsiella pneumoniae subsp. pneumoniae]